MRRNIYCYAISLIVLLLTGCYRDELCFEHLDGARVELKIDWSYAQLKPNSATAVIYKDDVYFKTEIFSVYPPVRKVVNLPVGQYSIVVYNEQESEYKDNLNFTGKNSWNTFETTTVADYIANIYSKAPSRELKADVDSLAVDRVYHFDITEEMIHKAHINPTPEDKVQGYEEIVTTIYFVPKRVFTLTTVVVNVKNGSGYYFTQRNPATLNGTSGSYFPGTGKYSESQVSFPVNLISLPKASTGEVRFQSTLQIVGLADYLNPETLKGSYNYTLSLPFTFSGGIAYKDIDLPAQAKHFVFTHEKDSDKPYHTLYIEVDIELPPLILVGGLEAEVEDWVDVDIPLDGPQRLYFLANNGSNESFWWQNIAGITVNLPASLFSPIDGLTFVGWNTQSDGSGKSYVPGDAYQMTRGSTFLYAIWQQENLPSKIITFHANDGTGETITSSQKPGALVPMPGVDLFTPPLGKRFKEWNTKPDGTGTVYYPDELYRMPNQDVNFYTIWN